MKSIIKKSILISISVFLLFSCNLFKPKYKQPLITYRVDTLKIEHFRYKLNCGKEMGWYNLNLAYPVFTSDSLPKVLVDFNNTIKDTIYKHALSNIRYYYRQVFPEAFDGRKRNCDSLIDFYRGYQYATFNLGRSYWENTVSGALDTSIWHTIFASVSVFIGNNLVSVAIETDHIHLDNLNIINNDCPYQAFCFNATLDENRIINSSECLQLKKNMVESWVNFVKLKTNTSGKLDVADCNPLAFFINPRPIVDPITYKIEHKNVALYTKLLLYEPIECPIDTVKKYFDVKYIDQ